MPSKGSYAKGVAKREEILQTALEVFSRQGYRKASLREISEAVGLTQAGLLHYFDSKEELFAEILRKRDEVDVLPARADGDLIDGMASVMRHNSEVPGLVHLYATLSAEGTDPAHPGHAFFVRRYDHIIGLFEQRLTDARADGSLAADLDPRLLARMFIALADGMQVQWLLEDDVDMGAAIETFWSLLQRVR